MKLSAIALLAILALTPVAQAEPYPNEGYVPATRSGFQHPGTLQGFNPQPDPPGKIRAGGPQPDPPGMIRGFDPQPDPPRNPRAQCVPAVQGGQLPVVQLPAVQRPMR